MKATLDPQSAFWKHEENGLPGCVHYQKLQNPDKENWEINNLYMQFLFSQEEDICQEAQPETGADFYVMVKGFKQGLFFFQIQRKRCL